MVSVNEEDLECKHLTITRGQWSTTPEHVMTSYLKYNIHSKAILQNILSWHAIPITPPIKNDLNLCLQKRKKKLQKTSCCDSDWYLLSEFIPSENSSHMLH